MIFLGPSNNHAPLTRLNHVSIWSKPNTRLSGGGVIVVAALKAIASRTIRWPLVPIWVKFPTARPTLFLAKLPTTHTHTFFCQEHTLTHVGALSLQANLDSVVQFARQQQIGIANTWMGMTPLWIFFFRKSEKAKPKRKHWPQLTTQFQTLSKMYNAKYAFAPKRNATMKTYLDIKQTPHLCIFFIVAVSEHLISTSHLWRSFKTFKALWFADKLHIARACNPSSNEEHIKRCDLVHKQLPEISGMEPFGKSFGEINCQRWEVTWKQDKVNYAVSEKEDRITDVTTVTGWRAVLECNWAVLSCTGLKYKHQHIFYLSIISTKIKALNTENWAKVQVQIERNV